MAKRLRLTQNNARVNIPIEQKRRMRKIMLDASDRKGHLHDGWSVYYSPTTRWPLTICRLRYVTVDGVLYEWNLLADDYTQEIKQSTVPGGTDTCRDREVYARRDRRRRARTGDS